MSKWQQVKLNDCCASISDGDHQAPPKSESGIPFVTISNIDCYNSLDFSNVMYVPQMYYDKLDNKRKAQKGDIIYSVVGSFGIPVLIKNNTPFVFQRHIAILKPGDDLDSRFLYYTMLNKDFYHKADAVAIGAAQRTISLTALRNLEISLPPIEVQRKIADVLSAYDDLIENNRRQIKLLEEAAQRLYKEWFIDLRFPGHESTPIINGIPDGWEKKPISAIAEYLNGFAFKPSDWQKEGKPIIKIKEMNQGILDDTPRNNGANIPSKYLIRSGDILFSWSATLSVMIWNQEDGWLNQHLFKVTPVKGFSKEFVLQAIANTLNEFQNLTTGATMKHIQRGKLDEVFVNVPPYAIMNVFSSCAETIRNKILLLSKQIQDAKETRDRLLPKLMTVELEVE